METDALWPCSPNKEIIVSHVILLHSYTYGHCLRLSETCRLRKKWNDSMREYCAEMGIAVSHDGAVTMEKHCSTGC